MNFSRSWPRAACSPERGVAGLYLPEFDLEKSVADYFGSAEWSGIIGKWEGYVRAVVERKG